MRTVFLIFAVFLLFSGCISEGEYSKQKKESLISSTAYDYNNDGLIDLYHYVFSEKEYKDYSIQREVYVYPNTETNSLNFNLIDETQVVDALAFFKGYSDQLKYDFEECSKEVGISAVKCAGIEHCASKCESATPKCKKLATNYPEFMGHLVYELDTANSERKSLANSINSDLWAYGSLSAAEKKNLFEDITSLYYLGVSVTEGPLFNHEEASICTKSISYSDYIQLFSLIGDIDLKAKNYKYLVTTTISSDLEEQGTAYTDLFVKEEIPISFDSDSLFLAQNSVVDDEVINWDPIRSDNNDEILFYTFESETTPDPSAWKTPEYKTRSIDLLVLQPTFFLFSIFLPLVGYHLSVSFSFLIPLMFLIVFINIFLLVYNIFKARIERKSFYRAIKNFAGVPNPGWKKDFVFGAVLFAIGIGAAFFARHVPDQTLQIFSLMVFIFEDYSALISIFGIIVGSLFVFISLQSLVNSLMLQMSYSGVVKKERKIVLGEVEELKQKLQELKVLIDQYRVEGFDITQGYNVYVSIPMDRLSKITKDNLSKEASFIENSLDKVENVISLMKERKSNAEKNWASWSDSIKKEFAENNEVYLSRLTFIPVALRTWAANKFVSENALGGVFFEGQVLRKKEVAPTEVVNKVMESGNIINALVVKDDKPFLTVVNSGNKTVFLGLFLKLSSYLKTFLRKYNQKEYKYLMGIGNNRVFALVTRGNVESLIVCPTEKFKQGFEQWKEVLKNIK